MFNLIIIGQLYVVDSPYSWRQKVIQNLPRQRPGTWLIHTCTHTRTDEYTHTYIWVLLKPWQLVFVQKCANMGNGVYTCASMQHVLAMFQSYGRICARVYMHFMHKYHSTDSLIQKWKSMKWKHLYIKISVLHGRNTWECHEELQGDLSHCALLYWTAARWVQTFTRGRVSTTNMPYIGCSTDTDMSVPITQQCMDEGIQYYK